MLHSGLVQSLSNVLVLHDPLSIILPACFSTRQCVRHTFQRMPCGSKPYHDSSRQVNLSQCLCSRNRRVGPFSRTTGFWSPPWASRSRCPRKVADAAIPEAMSDESQGQQSSFRADPHEVSVDVVLTMGQLRARPFHFPHIFQMKTDPFMFETSASDFQNNCLEQLPISSIFPRFFTPGTPPPEFHTCFFGALLARCFVAAYCVSKSAYAFKGNTGT